MKFQLDMKPSQCNGDATIWPTEAKKTISKNICGFYKIILHDCHSKSLTAQGKKLLCSLVAWQLILLYCQIAAEQLAYNVFYVGLAIKIYVPVGL